MNITAFGILALRAAGQGDVAQVGRTGFADAQNSNGGWGFAPGRGSEADSTGAALQALGGGRGQLVGACRRGSLSRSDPEGRRRLDARGRRRELAVDGVGDPGACGGARARAARSRRASPTSAKRQAADGHYAYSAASDQTPVWVTAQALTGVTRQAVPAGGGAAGARSGRVAGDRMGMAATGGPVRAGGWSASGGEGPKARRAAAIKGGGTKGRSGDERGCGSEAAPDGASVSGWRTEAPGTVDAEQAAAEDARGLTDAAKIGIGGGVLAVLVAGGVVYYRGARLSRRVKE